VLGKTSKKVVEASFASSFYRQRREREEEVVAVQSVGVRAPVACWSGWTTVRSSSPVPVAGRWASNGVFKRGVSPKWYGPLYSPVQPANAGFLIFSKLNQVCKLLKTPLY
jgi:hypothetical protein